jgi:hypothetical protein
MLKKKKSALRGSHYAFLFLGLEGFGKSNAGPTAQAVGSGFNVSVATRVTSQLPVLVLPVTTAISCRNYRLTHKTNSHQSTPDPPSKIQMKKYNKELHVVSIYAHNKMLL